MQTKFSDGSVGVAGKVTKDAEVKRVGDKQSLVASFSIIAGKRKDTTTIFVNCKAWRELAEYAAQIKKGDAVFAIGQIESREWNGKTYEDLKCVWLNIAKAGSSVMPYAVPEAAPSAPIYADFTEIEDDDENPLPF